MAYGNTPVDAGLIPLGAVYVPGVGLVAIQGRLKTTDGSSNDSALVEFAPYAASTATVTNVNGSASSVTILAANALRRGGKVFNDSSSLMYLLEGSSASTTSYSTKIPPMTLYVFDPIPIYTGQYTAVWDTATGAARITEETA